MKNAENRKRNSEKLVNLKSARGNLTDAINIYQTLQKQNILDPAYSKNPPEIAALIEKANREISRLAEK